MITFPNCKINLGLNILQKRKDGYHDIETVFYPIPIFDIVEIITSSNGQTELNSSGIFVPDSEENLCLKAYYLLKKDFPELPPVKIHLHKTIPIGAGLGGGSSDAAFTLSLLNKKFNLNIPLPHLFEYALLLGSDCPFFLLNKPAFATRRGEALSKILLSLSGFKILIVNPGIHISTKEIFSELNPAQPSESIKKIISQPVSTWKNKLINDFEEVIFKKYPPIKIIKENMYKNGAEYASMTGTGSSVFGIYHSIETVKHANENEYFFKWIQL